MHRGDECAFSPAATGRGRNRRPLALAGNEVDDERVLAMSLELAQLAGGLPVALPLVAVASARSLLAGRRRSALNEAMHELRRPLQALALCAPAASSGEAGGVESSLQMAAAALERLDREINGEAVAAVRVPLSAGPLLEAAVLRWRGRAAQRGGSLRLHGEAVALTVNADRREISQALDNLIVNALEHGGPDVVVAAAPAPGALRLSVTDSGAAASHKARPHLSTEFLARLTGRRRRGHGLRVVRRVAETHGGSFRLRRSEAGTEAVLDLPLGVGDRS
jgi:signal transduction histidine kinase